MNFQLKLISYCAITILILIGSLGCSKKTNIEFTEEEINWLSEHDHITLAVNDDYPPLNYVDDNNKLSGLNIDLIRLIELRTGLNIQLVGGTWEKSLSKAMNHEVDGIINATPLEERRHKLTFSAVFMDEPQALLSQKNGSDRDGNLFKNSRIGVLKNSNQLEVLQTLDSNVITIEVNSLEEGIIMLALSEIDGFYGSLQPIYHFITVHSLSSLEISYVNYDVQPSAIGLRNDNPVLLSIINKGISSISENEKNILKEKWLKFSSKNNYTLLYITLGLLLSIILLSTIWNVTLKRQVKKRTNELDKELKERKTAELKLVGEQQFSNTLLDSFPGLFFMFKFSPEPQLIRWNRNFEIILNYSSKELKHRHPLSFFDKNEQPGVENALRQLGLKKEVLLETKVLTKDFIKIPYVFFSRKLDINQDSYFFGFGYDITEQVKMIDELEKHRSSLENVVKERTQELADINTKLKEVGEFKEAVTAMIVHDFKNSLNTVISFSEGTPTERRLKSIRQAGQFMLNMVHNILDVQKFETTEFILALGNYTINKIIEDALDQLSYNIEQKYIKISYAQNSSMYARVDYELMTRVVVNILSNAIKYVTTNGEIEIIAEKKEKNIYVAIKDNGLGIPSDKLNQVFDRYSQINEKKSGSVRATGIGLTFCKMVVEAHKGMIGVESKEGEGSIFYFTLPFLKEDIGVIPLIEKSDAINKQVFVLSQKEKIALTPYLKILQKWEVYDYSEVTAVLEKLVSNSSNLVLWKDKMMKALQTVNEDKYNRLINIE